ncbi:MAG TPA: AmmeMemoRadiSam system protein B [Kofleriaceae bacterium]|nr:AmmeMemoRadiSam system protein B [Kofleriaceae bacterium]
MEGKPWIRPPAVAGRFYPGDPDALVHQVNGFLAAADAHAAPAVAVMVPHAGYIYSGGVAGRVFAAAVVPERVIVLCPNHTGLGRRVSVVPAGRFRLPGGDVPIDEELAGAVLAEVAGAEPDREAHRFEHAIEVELPFLRARQPGVRLVPIVLAGLSEADAVALGAGLHRAAQRAGGGVLVVASSDMSHYLPDEVARRIDRMALEPLLAFDPGGLYRTVRAHEISMCGFIPATAALAYARLAGARPPELVAYATSGDASGDRERVVGYAGVIMA